LTDAEQQRLARLAGIRLVHFREVAERRDPRHRAGWVMRFIDQPNGHCPFLAVTSNRCSIYESRPEACRRFPTVPTAGCLVWPQRTEIGG
jgi:Fe-S-cluster containining protein